MSRKRFEQQLEELHQEMVKMGSLCERAITQANIALLEGDHELAAITIQQDMEIDEKEKDIEALCLRLLVQQQPVARDLRQITAALKMITDMERIGDQASDISELSLSFEKAGDSSIRSRLVRQMAKETANMVTSSIDAYVKKDLELAAKVIADDDSVDSLFEQIKLELFNLIRKEPDRGDQALNLLMVAKYFERIGDHATNIAEWVVFAMTGRHDMDRPI